MTRHVRKGYRNHGKAAWAVALVAGAAIAAIVIPLALAAGTASAKYYTLRVSPNPVCTTPPPASTTVTLKNTAGSQTLGSVQIYFPAGSVATGGVSAPWSLASNQSNSVYFTGTKDVVSANYLGLAPSASTQVTVTFTSGSITGQQVTAAAKQSNTFNDTQGGANLFTLDPAQGIFPTLNVVPCVTVGGRVYEDRNFDHVYQTGGGAGFGQSDLAKAWTVSLYQKAAGAPSYPSTPYATRTSDSGSGLYSFANVPAGGAFDYKVCVAAAGADASSAWAVESGPSAAGVCGPLSASSDSTSPGYSLTALNGDSTSDDFAVNPVTAPFGPGDTSTVTGYTVTGGINSSKSDMRYVQETWVDSSGRTNFRFVPAAPCGLPLNCATIYLLETLTADVSPAIAALGGQQATALFYNDNPPFYDGSFTPMPYCMTDPRQAGGTLATSNVLPAGATSCIVTGSQVVQADGTVHVVYVVYSSHDGGRQLG
jgi:hypothetical protein